MDFNLKQLAKKEVERRERPTDDIANDKHQSMLKAIAPYAKKTAQQNLTPVYVDYKTRNTKLVLVLCPEWAPMFPPFNLARLSGIAKSAGYETKILDINIRTYNRYLHEWLPNKVFPYRLWDSSAMWHWVGSAYYSDIHPVIEPVLRDAVNEIIELNPDIVGFSTYYVNEEPTKWMCQELKKQAPHIRIAIGGSNVQKDWFAIHPYYDYVVNGEGEQVLLDILDEIERGVFHKETQIITQPQNQRINLNDLPLPDYESIDFSLYDIPNGVNSEISRGCTAKCTFCEETHFYKYRQRQAVDLISEVEWLYYNKGTDVIWFIDSLVNGNLKELRAFCKAVEAKGLKINWTGYARCDGRMDLEYFKDLKAGGCIMLNYGIESGSQRVLDDMDKGVTIAEMEQNFIDGKKVGIFAATNWIVGFPTEDYQDFADSMTFLWRMRNMNINNVGAGVGFGLGPETIIGQNPHRFNISYHKYHGHWITKDFTMAGPHVMTRVKSFYMFLDHMVGCTERSFQYPVRDRLPGNHYKINLHNPSTVREIEYEKFDYRIIKPKINPFADNLVNEMWPFFRMLWKCRGGYDAEIYFNPEIDLNEFGIQYGPAYYWATFKFSITDSGEWSADFTYKFDQQVENPDDAMYPRPADRLGPFYAQDYSKLKSNTSKRARILAKPSWDLEHGRTETEFWNLLEEEKIMNATLDFSFEYDYRGTGYWGDHKNFDVQISKNKKVKENLFTINLDSLKKKI